MSNLDEPVLNVEGPVILALFDKRQDAQYAVDELLQHNFGHQNVGYVIRGRDALAGGMIVDAQATKDVSAAAKGVVAGGVIGGTLMAVGSLLLPGVGPIVAGGILAATLGGAAAGAATGGLLGSMIGLGVSEHEAKVFEDEFNAGKAIVGVRAQRRGEEAIDILQRHGGYNIQNQPPVHT